MTKSNSKLYCMCYSLYLESKNKKIVFYSFQSPSLISMLEKYFYIKTDYYRTDKNYNQLFLNWIKKLTFADFLQFLEWAPRLNISSHEIMELLLPYEN